MGEVFLLAWEVEIFYRVRLSHSFGEWGAISRGYALHECRDSACWRPFGVRRNAAGVCSEMTQWGDFYASSTIFVRHSNIVALVKITLQRMGYISQNATLSVSF